MTIMQKARTISSQIGTGSAGVAYAQAGGDVGFADGQMVLIRMPTTIPKGSTINSATLNINFTTKNTGTTQNALHTVRAHAIGDSALLITGTFPQNRPQTTASVVWNCQWTANPTGEQVSVINVKAILDELLARSDYMTGGYLTFMIMCDNENGSDMAMRANNEYQPTPWLVVDFTEPVSDLQHTFNICENSEFSADLQPADANSPLPYWHQNSFYGFFVDSGGTIARDTTFTRLTGVPTLRFTCPTPPVETHKRTGPMAYVGNIRSDRPFIFNGWIYISTAVPVSSEMFIGDPYHGWAGTIIADRGKWVPFCTNPLAFPGDTSWATRYPAAGLNNFQAGWQFWISEPGFFESPFRQMPFNGLTPDPVDPGGSLLANHKSTFSFQQSVREWTPRTAVIRNGVVKKAPRFLMRSDKILQLAEPIKGGKQIAQLPATAITSLPAGKTISEL